MTLTLTKLTLSIIEEHRSSDQSLPFELLVTVHGAKLYEIQAWSRPPENHPLRKGLQRESERGSFGRRMEVITAFIGPPAPPGNGIKQHSMFDHDKWP